MYNSGSFRNPYSLYYSGDRGRQQRTVPVTQSQQQQQQQSQQQQQQPQPQPSQVQKDLRAASLKQKEQQQQDAKAPSPSPQHPLQDKEKDKETKPELAKQPSRVQAVHWERKPSEPAPAKPPALLEKASEKKKEEGASAFALASSKADSSSSSTTTSRLGHITGGEEGDGSKSENDKMSMALVPVPVPVPVPVKPNEGGEGGGGVTNKAIVATATASAHGSGSLQAAIREDMTNMARNLALADTEGAGGASSAGPPRIITLAGENRGAIMDVMPAGGGSLGLQQRQQPRAQSQSDDQRHDTTNTGSGVTAYVNSNVQASNNSILYNSSCPHRDPGVKLALSNANPSSPSPKKRNAAAPPSPSSNPKT